MATRGKNFQPEEERQLCLSFLHVSQDPIVGNGQKKQAFWERITAHFNDSRNSGSDEVRSVSSLESKWSTINADVSRFAAAYANVKALEESGTSLEDLLRKAHELFKAKHPKGKVFQFVSCWDVLKDVPKWQELGPLVSKKTKKLEKAKSMSILGDVTNSQCTFDGPLDSNSPPLGSNSDNVEGESGLKRPQGNRAAKDSVKRQKLQEDVLINQAKASAEMANAILQKVQLLKEQSLAALFSMKDDADMTEQGREFFRLRREQELARFKISLKTPSEEAPSGEATRRATPEVATVETDVEFAPVHSSPNLDAADGDRVGEEEDDDLEVLETRTANPPLNAWGEDPEIDI